MRSDIMFSSEDQIQSTTSSSSYFSNCVVQWNLHNHNLIALFVQLAIENTR
jgi:hypothetical protein